MGADDDGARVAQLAEHSRWGLVFEAPPRGFHHPHSGSTAKRGLRRAPPLDRRPRRARGRRPTRFGSPGRRPRRPRSPCRPAPRPLRAPSARARSRRGAESCGAADARRTPDRSPPSRAGGPPRR